MVSVRSSSNPLVATCLRTRDGRRTATGANRFERTARRREGYRATTTSHEPSSIEDVAGNCCSFRLATRNRDGARKEPVMARNPAHPRTVGHVSHDALQRVDKRVKEILARQEAALQQARRAAQRLKGR